MPVAEFHCFNNLIAFHSILTDCMEELPLTQTAVFDEVDFQVAFNEILSLTIDPDSVNLHFYIKNAVRFKHSARDVFKTADQFEASTRNFAALHVRAKDEKRMGRPLLDKFEANYLE